VRYHALIEEMAPAMHEDIAKTPRFHQQKLTLKNGHQGNSEFRDEYKTALNILMLATGLVLLIAMANAANLLLARSAERRKEFAIRAAMGAGRGELIGQSLTEALLLASAGGIAGLGIAVITLKLLVLSWGGGANDSFYAAGLNGPVLWFSLGLSFATGLLFGIYPAWDASRVTLAATLASETSKSSSSRSSSIMRTVLVCAQMTIAIVLLIPTGLFLKSLMNLLNIDLGIRTDHIVTFTITPYSNGYTPAQCKALFEKAETALAAIPGVRSAVGAEVPFIAGSNWGTSFRLEGRAAGVNSKVNAVGPDFFSKAGIPVLAGREIRETDTASSPKVMVVNETFVRNFLGGRYPIGLHAGFGKNGLDTEIVGVVKDSHYAGVRQPIPPQFFRPWRQDERVSTLTFYVRSFLPESQIVPQLRAVMRSIDPDVPLQDLRTLVEQIHFNIRQDELILGLSAAFALLATTLAMLGLYGVMAHGVARRTREIGIRMALGAAPAKIRSMVMRELLWIVGVGLGTGIPAALAASRVFESRLFGVQGRDASVVVAATAVLTLTAVAAAWWPARRASRIDPLDALRYE